MIQLVVFGHSHVWSVRRTLAGGWSHPGVTAQAPVCGTKELPGPVIYQQTGPAAGQSKPALNPVIIALLNKIQSSPATAETWMVSMVQGNFYNQIGMVAQGGLFDFVLDTRPDLPLTAGATLLACGAVRAVLAKQMAEFQYYATILAKTGFQNRMILVGPPPPPRGNTEIAALLAADPNSAREAIQITPDQTRLKLWHMQNDLAAGYCATARLHYLPGDLPGTQDKDGFILPAFIKDAVHANHDYAARLLRRLAEIATQHKVASHG